MVRMLLATMIDRFICNKLADNARQKGESKVENPAFELFCNFFRKSSKATGLAQLAEDSAAEEQAELNFPSLVPNQGQN